MSGRGRRIAIALIALALALSAGRGVAVFLAERLWEASVSEAVAIAGTRRALLAMALELAVLALSVGWCILHFVIAARHALPDRAPPERSDARLWPARIPRWGLTLGAAAVGMLAGSGASAWLDPLLLRFEGLRLGIPDPLLGADLGLFLADVPLWLVLQEWVETLAVVALAGTVLFHVAGGTIQVVRRRIWVFPGARGHLSVLLASLALALAWKAALEPVRLAAGSSGPVLLSDFLLRTLVAQVQAGLGAAAAVASFLWWLKVRGIVAVAAWALFGLGLLGGALLPSRTAQSMRDEGWRAAARRLDGVAFGLGGIEGTPLGQSAASVEIVPALWDPKGFRAAAADSGSIGAVSRGWIEAAGRPRAVWFAVRYPPSGPAALLALADDEVGPGGALLSWREGDSLPAPGARPYRVLEADGLWPRAPSVALTDGVPGVALDGWARRLIVAWGLQVSRALSAPAGAHLAWRLDPAVRLRAAAPFADWTAPLPRIVDGELIWVSDGLVSARHFPASAEVSWRGGLASMVRPAFVGTVNATSGGIRIFARQAGDSIAAAWARIAAPLIEPASATPPALRVGAAYPDELLAAQISVLQGAAWRAGRQELSQSGEGTLPPSAPGGGSVLAPLIRESTRDVASFVLARRTPAGDSLTLMRVDSAKVRGPLTLSEHWKRFPFQVGIRDSVSAAQGVFELGEVRYVIARDGVVAYQPAWGVSPSGRAELLLVSVVLDERAGVGRTFADAWRNLRRESVPIASPGGAEARLEQVRTWWRRADSALKRGDLEALNRAFMYLRTLLDAPAIRP
ncbi:MAG: COG1615 family transporter [Gemmatimonadales bacterium]|nr:COG1615 family transporter [Gemmatimonadales bacterium]